MIGPTGFSFCALLATTHVIVEKMPPAAFDPAVGQQTFWIGIAAFASLAAAGGTIFLATKTASLADETRRMANKTADLAAETSLSVQAAQDALTEENRRFVEGMQPHVVFFQEQAEGLPALFLQNVGPGFARNITVDFEQTANQGLRSYSVPALASGDRAMAIKGAGFWPPKNVRVTYFDAFGNKFETSQVGDFMGTVPYTVRKL